VIRVECDAGHASTTFHGRSRTGVLDEDLSHRARGDSEEVGPALPTHPFVVDQSQIGFVHESRRAQRVGVALFPHQTDRLTSQLVVNGRKQLIQRLRGSVGRADLQQKTGGGHTVGSGCH